MSTTAILDPAAAVAAAVSEVYDRLRELVERGPTDDPGLLDEIGALVRRARGRVTRARKRAVETEQPAIETNRPTAPAAVAPRPAPPAVTPAATPAADRITVRLVEPDPVPAAVPRSTSTEGAAAPSTGGRHRRHRHRAWHAAETGARRLAVAARLALLAFAVAVAGYASFLGLLHTDVPWTAPAFAAAYGVAGVGLLAAVGRHLSVRSR